MTSAEGVEVSPLVSYAGEALDGLCNGKTFLHSLDNSLQVQQDKIEACQS